MSVKQVKPGESGNWKINVQVKLPNGNRSERIRQRGFRTRREAEEAERQTRLHLLAGTYGQKKCPLFKEFAEEFLTRHVAVENEESEKLTKESTIRIHLNPFFGEMKLNEITAQDVQDFKRHQQEELTAKQSSVDKRLTILRKMLNAAREWGYIQECVKFQIPQYKKQIPRFLKFHETEPLIQAAQADDEEWWWTIIVVALHTGLRLGELIALTWLDIDFHNCQLIVRWSDYKGKGTKKPKSGADRAIPLNSIAIHALKQLRRDFPPIVSGRKQGPLVWRKSDGKPFTCDNLQTALERILKRAGLEHAGWHLLRHTFASHLVMKGVPIVAVQQLLGHADIKETMIYAHLEDDFKRRAVDSLAAPNSGQPEGNGALSVFSSSR